MTRPQPEQLTQEQFDELLSWLDSERDRAGEKYEQIRRRLIRLFVCRGSTVAEELADATINRVARKVEAVRQEYSGDPARYFCGVAAKVHLEYLRKSRPPAVLPPVVEQPTQGELQTQDCLDRCIASLTAGDRELILGYYHEQKSMKIEYREGLARQFGLSINALRIKACRLRSQLQKCVEGCIRRPAAEME